MGHGETLPDEAKELGVQVDLSHQEITRLIEEVEKLYKEVQYSGAEWLPVLGIGNLMREELGYEDDDEFQDALNGLTFSEFLDLLPFIEKKADPKITGGFVFKVKPEPPREQWRPMKVTYKITSTKDLWANIMKSPYGAIQIPEMEFEISSDGRRHINAIYHHIAAAVFELGAHVKGAGMAPDTKSAITDTIIMLNMLLDVPKPFTIVLEDPSGLSEFHPRNEEQAAKATTEYPGVTTAEHPAAA